MGVKNIPKNKGMLFKWDSPGRREFWMKNTIIPLLQCFLNSDMEVVKTLKRQPLDETLMGFDDIQYVLELNADEDVKEGDIVAYRSEKILIEHRVKSIDTNGFVTKGDANDERDAVPVTFTNYLGKTIFTIPFIGKIIMFFKSGIGLYLLVALILLNVLLVILEKDKDNTYEKQE